MSTGAKWWARLTAMVSGVILAVTIPAVAWASSNGVMDVAYEVARRKPRRGGIGVFGILGGLCCLVVVAIVVIALLAAQRRKRGGGH